MPFNETEEGQTHSFSDGCIPSHEMPTPESVCKHCRREHNYILPTGYCDGCINYLNNESPLTKPPKLSMPSKVESIEEPLKPESVEEILQEFGMLTRYCRSKFVLHKADCCNYYEGVESEPTVDMLLESEVKDLLTTAYTAGRSSMRQDVLDVVPKDDGTDYCASACRSEIIKMVGGGLKGEVV